MCDATCVPGVVVERYAFKFSALPILAIVEGLWQDKFLSVKVDILIH